MNAQNPDDEELWYDNRGRPKGTIRFTEKVQKRKAREVQRKKERKRTKWNVSEKHPQGKVTRKNPTNSVTAIAGHSFANRLKNYLNDQIFEIGQSWCRSLHIEGLNIIPLVRGNGRAQIEDFAEIETFVQTHHADAVIVEIGSNDLSYGHSVEALANKLVNKLRAMLRRFSWIQALVWCQVTPRWELRHGHKDVKQYNKDVTEFNEAMRKKIQPIDRLHHWRHRGLGVATPELMKDGIHPTTTEKGTTKYLASISTLCRWTRINQAVTTSESSTSSDEDD